jgi:glycosyltransferase involved in cell wall biosynthesis
VSTASPSAAPHSPGEPIPVTLILRRPVPGWHSIETVFATVVDHLPDDIDVTVHVAPRRSVGVVGRIVNVVDALRLRRRPGVFHVTGDVHYVALGLPRRRTVLTVHDLGTLGGSSRWRRSIIAFVWFHLPVRWVARVTVISAATRSALLALIPSCAGRVDLVTNPLPPDVRPRAASPAPAHPQARPVVLAIGATPNKNLHRLAEAIAPLDVRLIVVGAVPDDVRELLPPAHDQGGPGLEWHVDLSRSDLLELYARADVVTLVSTSEGFGIPVIEAQAAGVPVVASRIPPLIEIAGDAVRFVDPTDVADIRRGVTDVLADAALRAQLVQAGHANARRFDATRIAQDYAAVYRAVAASAAARSR